MYWQTHEHLHDQTLNERWYQPLSKPTVHDFSPKYTHEHFDVSPWTPRCEVVLSPLKVLIWRLPTETHTSKRRHFHGRYINMSWYQPTPRAMQLRLPLRCIDQSTSISQVELRVWANAIYLRERDPTASRWEAYNKTLVSQWSTYQHELIPFTLESNATVSPVETHESKYRRLNGQSITMC